jgi:hypothetical protein
LVIGLKLAAFPTNSAFLLSLRRILPTMRLGQLARRLSLRPVQIVDFLADKGIQIDSNSNTRLEDGHVTTIVQHYSPESLAAIEREPDELQEATPEVAQAEFVEAMAEAQSFTQEEKTAEKNTEAVELSEIIRVQKVELSGLKVLGKIELPEQKKKEPVTEEATNESAGDVSEKPVVEKLPKQRNRKPEQNRERSQQRSWKNPVELQRDRESREAEAKKQRDLEREKEKRKKHYQEKMKSSTQPKKAKVKVQPEGPKKPVDTRPVPKTWLGKFLRWWTT